LEADLVVIGGGGAGMAAATAAAELGASVVVLEKRRLLGGNSMRGGIIFGCESPVQKRDMILSDKDELFQAAMKWAHWDRVDPAIVRAFINKSGDTIRWLQEKGIDFIFTPLYPGQARVGHHASDGGGRKVVDTLEANCREKGVTILLQTGATRIIRGSDGAVTGVVANTSEHGENPGEIHIQTSSAIVASGGIGGNPDLLKKHCPAYYDGMRLHGVALTGDGLLLAAEAGAAIADTIPLLKEGPNPDYAEVLSLKLIVSEPYTIWVNKTGRRFIDEYAGKMIFESGNAILRQPGKVMFTVFDSDQRRVMETITPPAPPKPKGGAGEMPPMLPDQADLAKTLEFYEKKGVVKIADSWGPIAEWIGADPAVLAETVETYNDFCDHGYDVEFAKERKYLSPLRRPPFYAIRCATTFLDTLGGIKINAGMEVLDTNGDVIPGFYAAGVIADGHQSDTYCSETAGAALGFAINSGRIAGENAAGFVRGVVRKGVSQ
jgi:fumarate reductase flavoprotein subunit